MISIFGWMLAANIFVVLRIWGIKDTTGFIVLRESFGYLWVHIEATTMGCFVSLILLFVDKGLEKSSLRKRSFGKIVLVKGLSYIATIVLVVGLISFIFLLVLGTSHFEAIKRLTAFMTSTYYLVIILYGIFVSFMFSFIGQVNNKFGPGILVNMLRGKYHKPREEDRVFMFLDLKDSTSYAEKLGHIKYSRLIQDCFYDLAEVVNKYHANIYQYVGDEAVLTWKAKVGLEKANCLTIYFGFVKLLKNKTNRYINKYGFVPEFKAGVNYGRVTVAEVGVIKKEIAYHGDVLNTASRIQGKCNQFSKKLLISGDLYNEIKNLEFLKIEQIGSITLKGKKLPVDIYAVDDIDVVK